MKPKLKIAIQLYSLRTILPDQLENTIQTLSKMGYEGVEFAGLYDRPAADIRRLLKAAKLGCAGAHVGMKALTEELFPSTVEIYREAGADRLIVPSAPMDNLPSVIRELHAIHVRARAAGCRVGFHNHAQEFEPIGNTHAFDKIFQTMPDEFLLQLDIGWAVAAGQNVPTILTRFANRIETVHVKEYKRDDKTAVVGEGEVDWPPIFQVLRRLPRLEWLIIEQEQHAGTPLESAERCLKNTLHLMG